MCPELVFSALKFKKKFLFYDLSFCVRIGALRKSPGNSNVLNIGTGAKRRHPCFRMAQSCLIYCMQLSLKRLASGWVSPFGSPVATGIFLFVTTTDCLETVMFILAESYQRRIMLSPFAR